MSDLTLRDILDAARDAMQALRDPWAWRWPALGGLAAMALVCVGVLL